MNLVFPMFAMVLLTVVTLLIMGRVRIDAVRTGKVKLEFFKTYSTNATEVVLQTARHYENLFEMPVLFYAAALTAMIRGFEGPAMIFWAWLFVAARVAHAIIHLGSNKIPIRMASFVVGVFAVCGMWISILIATCT